METNDFVDRLLDQVSLEAIDFASDVERLLAEQVVFLRGQIESCRREAIVGSHERIEELYARLADKDAQIAALTDEVQFLRSRFSS